MELFIFILCITFLVYYFYQILNGIIMDIYCFDDIESPEFKKVEIIKQIIILTVLFVLICLVCFLK